MIYTNKKSRIISNKTNMYLHTHHQLPRKAPYLSELHHYKEEWLVDLTIEGHAIQHEILYKVFGWEGDRIAYQGLSGFIGKEEIHRNACVLGGKQTPIEQLREMGRLGSASRKKNGGYSPENMRSSPVIAINKETGETHRFKSCKECANTLGLHAPHVSECSRNVPKRKSTGGYYIRRAL
jgi:hypothetical protein